MARFTPFQWRVLEALARHGLPPHAQPLPHSRVIVEAVMFVAKARGLDAAAVAALVGDVVEETRRAG